MSIYETTMQACPDCGHVIQVGPKSAPCPCTIRGPVIVKFSNGRFGVRIKREIVKGDGLRDCFVDKQDVDFSWPLDHHLLMTHCLLYSQADAEAFAADYLERHTMTYEVVSVPKGVKS